MDPHSLPSPGCRQQASGRLQGHRDTGAKGWRDRVAPDPAACSMRFSCYSHETRIASCSALASMHRTRCRITLACQGFHVSQGFQASREVHVSQAFHVGSKQRQNLCRARQKLRLKGRLGRSRDEDAADVEQGGDEEKGDVEIFSLAHGWRQGFEEEGASVDASLALGRENQAKSSPPTNPAGFPKEDQALRHRGVDRKAGRRGTQGDSSARQASTGSLLPKVSVIEERRTTHKMLKVMAGELRGKRLLSPADRQVRPMMELVRGAVFNMVQALAGSPSFLPGGRWLDLYSGTGSVGIEALSRGCSTAHFVEMDPWVVSSVLLPNLQDCNYTSRSHIHTLRVESFLDRALKSGADVAGGPFDYISVTPPYEAVVYADLMLTLHQSPLVSEHSCIVVEYPLLSKDELPEACGPLVKLRDRRYGRTNVAVYGPKWASRE